MASSDGDQLLAIAFHVIMDKIEADILPVEKKWNWKLSRYVHQSTSIFKAALGSLGQNIKTFQPKY